MSSNLEQDVLSKFGDVLGNDEKIVKECASLCEVYALSAEELYWKWEAQRFVPGNTRSEIATMTMDTVSALKAQIVRDRGKQPAKKAAQPRNAVNLNVGRRNMPSFMKNNAHAAAAVAGRTVKTEPVDATMDDVPVTMTAGMVAGPSKVVFQGPSMDPDSKQRRAYRYMNEKTKDRVKTLDDRIVAFARLVQSHYNLPAECIHDDPSKSSDDEIYAFGRIVQDSDSIGAAKIVDSTITLETSRFINYGQDPTARVSVKFDPDLKIRGGIKTSDSASGVGLFPGAMVALKGKNGGGGWFSVSEILTLPSAPSPPKEGKIEYDAEFSVVTATGPFTPDSDLEFVLFKTLIRNMLSSPPSVVVLIGPFIDCAHPKIKSGDVDFSPLEMMHKHIIEPLRALLDSSPGTTAVLVPSVRDIISSHSVYPQAEFGPEVSHGDPRIHLVPNPARFTLNGISFGVSSVDVLFHLKKEEFVKRGTQVAPVPPTADDPGTDSMTNLCRHLLQQRSFYPIFPPPLDLSSDVNLDLSHSTEPLRLSETTETGHTAGYAPDVLILPSRLKHFSKTVHSTKAVNPSSVWKGTYALLKVGPRDAGREVKDRLSAEIVKLDL